MSEQQFHEWVYALEGYLTPDAIPCILAYSTQSLDKETAAFTHEHCPMVRGLLTAKGN